MQLNANFFSYLNGKSNGALQLSKLLVVGCQGEIRSSVCVVHLKCEMPRTRCVYKNRISIKFYQLYRMSLANALTQKADGQKLRIQKKRENYLKHQGKLFQLPN